MYLRELVLESDGEKQQDINFSWSVNCVVDLYFDCLPKKTFTGEFGKIIITVGKNKSFECSEQLNVLQVYNSIDFEQYWSLSDIEKKKYITSYLIDTFNTLTEKYKWDGAVFREAEKCVIEKNYERKGYLGKPIYSPNKKRKARIYIEHTPDEIKTFLVVSNVRGKKIELLNKYVTKVKPHWFFVYDTIEAPLWKDDYNIVIKNKNNNQSWEYCIETNA